MSKHPELHHSTHRKRKDCADCVAMQRYAKEYPDILSGISGTVKAKLGGDYVTPSHCYKHCTSTNRGHHPLCMPTEVDIPPTQPCGACGSHNTNRSAGIQPSCGACVYNAAWTKKPSWWVCSTCGASTCANCGAVT